jgi:PEP-CTERM motif
MNWRMLGLIAMISSGALVFAPAARAELLDFSFVDSGGDTANFTMDSQPQPSTISSEFFNVTVLDGTQYRTGLGKQDINFIQFRDEPADLSSASTDGGFITNAGSGLDESSLVFIAPVLFTGTPENPVFAPGDYVGSEGTLLVTVDQVPEPATFGLIGIAMAGLGFVKGRRRSA